MASRQMQAGIDQGVAADEAPPALARRPTAPAECTWSRPAGWESRWQGRSTSKEPGAADGYISTYRASVRAGRLEGGM